MNERLRMGWAVGMGCAGLLMLGSADALAVSGDADGTYTVTVTKVEISTDGTTFLTLFEGSSAINIASVTAGAAAAALVSGKSITPGAYTTIRTTIGSTMQAKGYVNISGTTFYTNNDSDGFGAAAGNDNQNQSDYAISTFTIPEANRVATQSVSVNVSKSGNPPTVSVAFNTSGTIVNSGGLPSLGPPTVTISSS